MIWDRGSWEPEGDVDRGLQKGHLSFKLNGKKLHGGWHLVRMHRRPGEKRDNWLLIKQHDEAERSARDKDILEEMPLSVVSGRDLEQIANKSRKVWHSNRAGKVDKTAPDPTPRVAKPAKRTTKKAAKKKAAKKASKKAKKKTAKKTKSRPARAANSALMRQSPKLPPRPRAAKAAVGAARKSALPAFVEPALATLVDKPPDSANWIHEIKFDGYRIQARLDHGKVKLMTRKGLDWTAKFPTVRDAIADLPAATALIDGELVAEDKDGISRFSLLQQDLKAGRSDRMVLYAFDLLHLDGADLKSRPLSERKAALAKLLRGNKGVIRLSESLTEPGTVLLKHACRMGLEGIVSKRADAPYRSGRGHDWLKSKCSDRQEFVIAGFAPASNDAHAVGALVLAVYDKGTLRHAGRTGTGFTHDSARALYRTLHSLARKTSPFAPVPKEERGKHAPVWVEPKLVAEVEFRGWTHGDRVRQSSFQGLREDKAAKDVVREVKAMPATNTQASAAKRSAPVKASRAAKPKRGSETIGTITLTHPDRVYWHDVGITKRDLADYYTKVWRWMRPHVVGRVIALVRCPEGADAGQCFFQKHARAGIPTEHLHLVADDGDKSISIDDLDGVIALVQGGVLEIHTRGSTIDHLEKADRLVFDFDPGPGTSWADIVAAARDVRERLAGIKLKTFVKTSGGKGLHVVLPIQPAPWDEAKAFARTVAEAMAADAPDKYVATATKAKRQGRIFVDYLRNSREATAVAPFSTRARPGAPVSVPVDWTELGSLKSASQYTVQNVMQRLSRLKKDPWADIGRVKQALPRFK
jgi:bifunctional non-homologous end joining protein LigD